MENQPFRPRPWLAEPPTNRTARLPAEELDTEFKKKYPPEPLGEELADYARVWKVYQDEATKADAAVVDGWNKTLDILLVFAGLFSAVVTSFVGQSNTQLRPDTNAYLANALFHLVTSNGNVSALPAPPSLDATPTSTDVLVNALWFTSLLLSLAVAFLCILAKQWIGEYVVRTTPSSDAHDWSRRRAFYFRGLNAWGLPGFLSVLPVLLHLSLFLFIVGLCLSMWAVSRTIALCLISVGGCLTVFYIIAALVPFWRPDCPTALPLIGQLRAALLVVLRTTLAICIRCSPAAHKAFKMLRRCILWPVYDACIDILLKVRRRNLSISRHSSYYATPFHVTVFDEQPGDALTGESVTVPRGLYALQNTLLSLRGKTFRDAHLTCAKDLLDAVVLRWLILDCSNHDAVAVGYQAVGAVVPDSSLAHHIDIDHAVHNAISFETACTYTSTATSSSPTEIMRILRSILFLRPPFFSADFHSFRYSWMAPLRSVNYPDMVLVSICEYLYDGPAREELENVALPLSDPAPSPTIQSTLALLFRVPSSSIQSFCTLLLGASKDTLTRNCAFIAGRLCKGYRGCPHLPCECPKPLQCLSEALCAELETRYAMLGVTRRRFRNIDRDELAARAELVLRLLSFGDGYPTLFDRPHLLSCLTWERFSRTLDATSAVKSIAALARAPKSWRFTDLDHCIKAITGLARLCLQFASEAQQDHTLAPELKNLIDHILIYVVFLAADSQLHCYLGFVPPALEMFIERPRAGSPRLIPHADTTLTTDFVARAPWANIFALLPWASSYRLEIACLTIGALCSKDCNPEAHSDQLQVGLKRLDQSLVHLLQDGQSNDNGRDILCDFARHRMQLGEGGWAPDVDRLEAAGVAYFAGEITRDALFLGPCAECSRFDGYRRWERETEVHLVEVCKKLGFTLDNPEDDLALHEEFRMLDGRFDTKEPRRGRRRGVYERIYLGGECIEEARKGEW